MGDYSERTPVIDEQNIAPTEGLQSERTEENNAVETYWCYNCNKEVDVTRDAQNGVECVDCHGGFVEAVEASHPDFRRGQHRRRRRRNGAPIALSDALDHMYPQQIMQVLQLLGHAAIREAQNRRNPVSREESVSEQIISSTEDGADEGRQLEVRTSLAEEQVDGLQTSQPSSGGSSQQDESESTRLRVSVQVDEIRPASEPNENEGEEEESEAGGSDAASESGSDTQGLRLEIIEGWGNEESEWEEIEDEEQGEGRVTAESRETPASADANDNAEQLEPPVRRPRGDNFQMYLQMLVQNLMSQNVELRVEMADGATYIGNAGDYLDGRGFEQLLQQLAENDNSRKGAPPASKSAIELLPTILLEQQHLDSELAACAVCKDSFVLGEASKQLPCGHLYHEGCILPWLSCRNSCPVCRYELPTDDPEYEEQKKQHASENNGSSVTSNTGMHDENPGTSMATSEVQAQQNSSTGSQRTGDIED